MTTRARSAPSARVVRFAAAVACVATAALAGCGGTHTQTDADEGARRVLGWNVGTAVTCLWDVAPDLRPDLDPAASAETLMPCGGTTFYGHDDEAIRTVDPLGSVSGTIVVSGSATEDHLTLELVTSGSALAEAGHSRARALVTTCWQVEVDLASDTVGDPSGAPCNQAVVERENPSEVVPFDEVAGARAGAVAATYRATGAGGDTAFLDGVLRGVDGCVVVETDDGETVVPVFPDRDVHAGWGDTLVHRGETFTFGQRATFTGGYTDAPWSTGSADVPGGCGDRQQFVVAPSG